MQAPTRHRRVHPAKLRNRFIVTSLIGCDLIHSPRRTFAGSALVAIDAGTWVAISATNARTPQSEQHRMTR